jgi:SnoaL-like domain
MSPRGTLLVVGAVLLLVLAGGCSKSSDSGTDTAAATDNSAEIAQVRAQVAQAKAMIDRVNAMNDVENLQRAYGFYMDFQLWDQIADLFADDATIEYAQRGVYVGKDHIRKFLDLLGPAGPQAAVLSNNYIVQPVINLGDDGKTAKIRVRAFMREGAPGKDPVWENGVYENEAVKRNGVWMFSKVHFYPTFVAKRDGGWTKGTLPIATASKTLPPDQPPTEVYGQFPEVYTPPYHYQNPVTHPAPEPAVAKPEGADTIAALQDELAALKSQVTLAQDMHDIERVQRAYGYYLDNGLWEDLAVLFTENATASYPAGTFHTAAHVRSHVFLNMGHGKIGYGPGRIMDHMLLQPVVHVDPGGTTAKGRWHLMGIIGGVGGGGSPTVFDSNYELEYAKVDGVWKISHLVLYPGGNSTYENGWGAKPPPPGAPKRQSIYDHLPFPRDAPRDTTCVKYPTGDCISPFDFANPVTGRK